MKLLFAAIFAFLIGEAIAVYAFAKIRGAYGPKSSSTSSERRVAILKGVLERVVMYLGLLMNYAVIIAAFGAFKLGTRFEKDIANKVSNDYFLVGNLTSLLIVLFEVLVYRGLLSWIS